MKKLLVVEDDKFLRDLITRKLRDVGYDVVEAIDGEEGLVKAQEENPDLILPGMDGFEVLSKLKEDPKTSQIKVIILSNLGQREDIERGLRLGAEDFLVKAHFTPAEIIEKIRNLVGE